MAVTRLNPPGLARTPFFSQAVVVPPGMATVYVGGQNAVDADGALVGGQDLGKQAARVFENVATALEAAGGDLGDVVAWTVHVVQGLDVRPALAAFQDAWGDRGDPPAITVAVVPALARPDCLCEVSAVAAVPAS